MELKNLKTKIKNIILCCCLVTLTIIESHAQLYPVQVTPQLVPPYSVYLSDYAAPGSEKLRVIILQRDLTQPSYQLRLVMSIEWNGKVIMRTAKAFNPKPLNLDPGVPTIISGADLAPYVDSRNIDFIGYSREQYERTRTLPEGSYRIMFTAYDYRRQDVQVSNEGSSFYYLSKNEPPLINFPACGTKIPMKDPQQIVFSWLPRNTSSPTSAADTEYEFTLYETRPAGRNPNDVVNTTQPVFSTRTDATTLVYGPSEPILFENMKYVWRVQAIDKSGKDAFRNNGKSEVCTFTYGGTDATFDIGIVKNLQAVGETERRAKISWEASNYDGYKVYYKKIGTYAGSSTPYEWFWSNVTTNELTLFNLEPDTEYETRVQVKKSGVFGPYSEIIKFRTQPKQVIECGKETELAKADESKPLLAAQQGMTILVDDMHMTLVNVRPLGAGWFEGIGTVAPKILGRANFYVQFKRLYIDENLVAGFGRIDFVSKGVVELVKQQLANAITKDKQAQQQANRDQWSGQTFQEKIFKYDEIIADVQFDIDALILTNNEGNTFPNTEIPQLLKDAPEKAIIIEDKNGDQWVVQKDKNGDNKITKVPGGGLVVGPDRKIVNEKALSGLYSKILKALREYQNAIDEYLASVNQTQPSRGGGPSLFEDEIALLVELPQCLAPHKDQIREIATNVKMYRDSGSAVSIQFIVPVSKILIEEFPTEADRNNASYEKVKLAVCEAIAASRLMYSWGGSLIDKHHTELFDHIFAHNKLSNLEYYNKIKEIIAPNPEKMDYEDLELNYNDNEEYAEWINSWKLRVVDTERSRDGMVKAIQDARKGNKIGAINLKPYHIYISKYTYDGQEYPIAIYREKNDGNLTSIENAFTKVEVFDEDDLDNEENKKHLYVEETFMDYFIIAFYETGKTVPSVMMQVEKFPLKDFWKGSKEKWLRFLKILVKEATITENKDLLAKILPPSLSESDFNKYEEMLNMAKSSSGLASGIQLSDWVTDQTWSFGGQYYSSGETALAENGKLVLIDTAGLKRQCWEATKMMIENSGFVSGSASEVFQLSVEYKNESKMFHHELELQNGIRSIMDHLKDSRPIQIGVHYAYNKGINWDKSTDHFVVVTSMKFDQGYYFEFYDPGTSNSDKGTNLNNRLYIKEVNGSYIISGKDSRENNYIATEVRPNGDSNSKEGAHNVAHKSKEPCETKFCF